MQIPTIKRKEVKMGIKSLVGRRMSKEFSFMGEKVKVSKLSVAEVMEIQERAKDLKEDSAEGFEILKHVIRSAVEDAKDLTDEDFSTFPMDELSKLSNEIMKFSGLGTEQTGK